MLHGWEKSGGQDALLRIAGGGLPLQLGTAKSMVPYENSRNP